MALSRERRFEGGIVSKRTVKLRVESRERLAIAAVRVSALSDLSAQTRGLARPPPGTLK